jgi:hypothetical protein
MGLVKVIHLYQLFARPVARDQADRRPPHAERVGHRLDQCPIGRALDGARCDPHVQDPSVPFRTRAGGAWVSPDH